MCLKGGTEGATRNPKGRKMQNEKEELELEKLQAEIHKLVAETRKMIAETNKLKRETSFYPFVATGGLITVIVTAAAFIHKF